MLEAEPMRGMETLRKRDDVKDKLHLLLNVATSENRRLELHRLSYSPSSGFWLHCTTLTLQRSSVSRNGV